MLSHLSNNGRYDGIWDRMGPIQTNGFIDDWGFAEHLGRATECSARHPSHIPGA